MSNILVTGAGGYIGSHVAKKLLKEGHKVIALDNFSHGYREPLEIIAKYGERVVYEGDLCNKEDIQKVFKKEKINAVMHLAALCSVDESMKYPEVYFKNNLGGTTNLLEVMREEGVKYIIFSSTCAIYQDTQNLPVKETDTLLPGSPYAASKLMAEKIIAWFEKLHGINYVILRYFNVCGADNDGEIGDSKNPSLLLVQNAVRAAFGIEEFQLTSPKVDTPDGTPIRDYVDVEDIAQAHVAALEFLVKGNKSDIFNLGSGTGSSVKEIINTVKKELNTEFPTSASVARQGESARVCADISKAKQLLNFHPEKKLADSIQSLKKWYTHKPHGFQT